jgi:hypothetical protein
VCSYNKLRFPPETNLIVGPIDIPCTSTVSIRDSRGRTVTRTFDIRTACDADSRSAIAELAYQWLRTVRWGRARLLS